MNKLRRRTTLYVCLFLAASFCLMAAVILRRNYDMADNSGNLFLASDFSDNSALSEKYPAYNDIPIVLYDSLDAPTIFFPLPENVHFENIRFENHYPEHTLSISIQTDNPSFAGDSQVIARSDLLSGARYSYDDTTQLLTIAFTTNTLMEFFPAYISGQDSIAPPGRDLNDADLRYDATPAIVVTCQEPAALYDNVIIIDPIVVSGQTGVSYQEDAALLLATKIREQAAALQNGSRVYVTRTGSEPMEKDMILNLIRESGATKYLALMLPEGNVSLRASAYFNDRFYIRDYGNLQLAADALQTLSVLNNITLTGVYATGTDTAVAEAVLDSLKIPGAMIRIDGLNAASQEDDTRLSRVATALLNTLNDN